LKLVYELALTVSTESFVVCSHAYPYLLIYLYLSCWRCGLPVWPAGQPVQATSTVWYCSHPANVFDSAVGTVNANCTVPVVTQKSYMKCSIKVDLRLETKNKW